MLCAESHTKEEKGSANGENYTKKMLEEKTEVRHVVC